MNVLFSVFSVISLLVLILGFVGALAYLVCNVMDSLGIGKDLPSDIADLIENNCGAYFILAGFAAAAWMVAALVLVAISA